MGSAADLLVQLSKGIGPNLAGFAFIPERRIVTPTLLNPAIKEAVHNVHAPPDTPAREFRPAGGIHHLVVGYPKANAEVFEHRIPEPGSLPGTPRLQCFEGCDAVVIHESLQVGRPDYLRVGSPGDLLPERKRLAHGLLLIAR